MHSVIVLYNFSPIDHFHIFNDNELYFNEPDDIYTICDPILSNSNCDPQNNPDYTFENPDFSFMQFRSNLVFRWEYKLGSTLYLVWAHDRSGWESIYNPVSDITGDLFGIKGNHVFMFKLNFWFSI